MKNEKVKITWRRLSVESENPGPKTITIIVMTFMAIIAMFLIGLYILCH